MTITTHSARITGLVSYLTHSGRQRRIPIGPCLVENAGGPSVEISWGAKGQNSAALPVDVIEAAQDCGHLVLLD